VLGAGTALAETYWHVDPSWRCSLSNDHVARLHRDGTAAALGTTAVLSLLEPGSHPLAQCSRVYGRLEPAPTLRGTLRLVLPATIATFIPSSPELAEALAVEPARVETGPGDGWHACAFRARWRGGAMVLLASVERSGVAACDGSAPARRWGTAALETDARVALLVERIAGASEAILINGSGAHAPANALVSLPARAPALRMFTGALAPTMHEVVPADS
jgi:hypothetical protein